MATDNKAVQNQKVFIQLNSVLDLQKEYLKIRTEYEATDAELKPLRNVGGWRDEPTITKMRAVESRLHSQREQKRTFERIIKTLGLPIEIPFGG